MHQWAMSTRGITLFLFFSFFYTIDFLSSSTGSLWCVGTFTSHFGWSHKYYISFIDDYTQFVWLCPLHLKSEVAPTVVGFTAMTDRTLNTKFCLQANYRDKYWKLATLLHSLDKLVLGSSILVHININNREKLNRSIGALLIWVSLF